MNIKMRIIGPVSALAILMALTAYTEAHASTSASTSTETNITAETRADLKEGLENTKDVVSEAAQKVSDKTSAAYESIKAKVISEKNAMSEATYDSRITAKGLINQPINNAEGKKIGTLKDIILDHDGKAAIAVVSDGGFVGIGDKLAAFDYNLLMRQDANGDVIMPISEDAVSKVAEFSYEPKDASDKVRVIPENGYSVSEMLKGKLVNPKGEAMGNIENITFIGGHASSVIIGFDDVAGVGGERVALNFNDLALSKNKDGGIDFRMGNHQSAQFEELKKSRTN